MREKELEVQKKAEEIARKKAQENEQKKKRKIPIIMIMRQMVWTLIHLL